MKEDLLHFIWQSKMLWKEQLKTVSGENVQVIQAGMLNTDAGPDFFNAKVKIGDTLWAGNIEIHLRSSDWKHHHHQHDKKYNSVILHVVYHHDAEICYDNGKVIPTLELRSLVPPYILQTYRQLQLNQNRIACEKIFALPQGPQLTNWMERLLVERLENKCGYIDRLLNQNNNHWEESFYTITARYFGMKTNAQPFEWLANNLPLQVLGRHKHSLPQIQALVFGVAGFLGDAHDDPYISLLQREFAFLQQKYGLNVLDKSIWKFARTRPANFPNVRLAQFSALIFRSSHLLSKVLEAQSVRELAELYHVEPDDKIDPSAFMPSESTVKQTALGEDAIELLLINTVLPVLFLYGRRNAREELCERALQFYSELKPEDNTITRFWRSMGMRIDSSFDSQSLIELKNNYCSQLRCLNCIIGKEILLAKA